MLTMYQIQMYAKKFLKDTYNMELGVPLTLNSRMKRTCGWFRCKKYKHEAVKIELNKYFVENNEPTVVLDVLRHELVHYALYMQEKPYKDGQKVFEDELKRLGIVSQKTIDKYEIASKPVRKTVSVYQCIMPSCKKEYTTGKALSYNGVFHKCRCGGAIKSLGKRVVAS